MRKLIAILSVCTLALAASTLWLRSELAEERARRDAAAVANPASAAVLPTAVDSKKAAALFAEHVAPAPAPSAVPASSPPQVHPGPPGIEQQRKSAREYLDIIATPEERERLLAEARRSLLTSYPRLAERVGLSPAELRDFIELQAELGMEFGEKMSRCVVDPGCDSMGQAPLVSAELRQRRVDFLGEERHARFLAYEDSQVERRTVAQLRANLPDSAYLSEESSESLISAIATERRRYEVENSGPQIGPSALGTTDGTIHYMPGKTIEDSLESAGAYVKRVQAVAAPILNSRQLVEFDEMQRRLLTTLREHLEEQEVLQAGSP